MKKQVLCIGIALHAVMCLQGAVTKNKHLVQEHITALENKLKTQPLYAEDRRKVIGHLRGYFNNVHNKANKRLKPLSPNARQVADSVISAYTDIERTAGNHKQAGINYAQRATGVIALNVRPHGADKMKSSMKRVQPTAAEPIAKSKKSGGWLQDMESKWGLGDEEPSQKPVRSSVGRTGGVAAAGAAGAAAGTVAASRAQKAKAPAKKVVNPKKKAQKLERKKKRAAATKKAGAKKPRTKPMSEKKKAKKAKKAAAERRAKTN